MALALLLALPALALERDGDRFVDEQHHAVALSWAFGLTDVADLAAYRECGLNTVYIDLPAPEGADPQAILRLADSAGRQGFHLILGLNPVDALGPAPLDVGDPDAVQRSVDWLSRAVDAWKTAPGLVAWGLQHDVEERLSSGPAALTGWLARRYGGRLELLNSAWDSRYRSFAAINADAVASHEAGRPGGFGPGTLELARQREEAVSDTLSLWARAIQADDPVHPVLGGRMRRYRTLLAAPTALAGLQPFRPVGDGRGDPVYHEAGAVAVANQSGRFAAFPTLTAAADPDSLWRWTRLAFARGAAGVGWSAWPDLKAAPGRAAAVRHALDEVTAEGLAEYRPEPGAAVLLEPFARGPMEDRDGLLGYAWVGGDGPAAWYDLLDRGTRYGPLAVLTPRDLERVRLDGFGCLFAAAAFDLPAPAVDALRAYVQGGGLLVADLGLGCATTAGCLGQLPPPLEEVFGLRIAAVRWTRDNVLNGRQRDRLDGLARGEVPFPELAAGLSQPGSFVFLRYSSLLPDIVPRQPTPPGIARSLLTTPSAYVVAGPGTRMLAEQNQIGGRAVSGISEHVYGQGVACFITSWLWQEWRAGDWLFDRFHGNLLAQRPRLTVREGDSLVPDGWDVGRGRGGQLWVHRLLNTPGTLSIDLPCLEPVLYAGGLCAIRRAPPLDRAARVRATAEPLVNRRVESLDGAQLRREEALPIALWPLGESMTAGVAVYAAAAIDLQLWGPGDEAVRDARGRWLVQGAAEAPFQLTIADGAYRVAPGSLHRVAIWRGEKGTPLSPAVGMGVTRNTLTAGPDGTLTIRDQAAALRITITPVEEPPGPPAADAE